MALGAGLCLGLGPAGGAAAQTQEIHTTVVVDSNPALFAMLTALNAAGYDTGLPSVAAPASLRQKVRAELAAQPAPPALAELRAFYQQHMLADPSQNLAQYVTLALFLGNPPGLTLTLPAAGLPPDAAAVVDVIPILQRYYAQAHLDAIWQQVQPQYALGLAEDSQLVRQTLATVDAFFRMPDNYSSRQYFIFPDAMIAPNHSDALSYQDNYYFVSNLALEPQMRQVRHTYLHFVLDPLIASLPAAYTPVEQQLMPLVQDAPALEPQFKKDVQLFYTECLVRAVEIQLDPGTPAQKQAAVAAAMADGLVLTQYWFNELTSYRSDPANFREFYPEAAFAARMDEITGTAKHIAWAPAAAAPAASVQPVRVAGPLERAQERFDAHDLAGAAALAQAALRQPGTDAAPAYFLLGKVAAEQNQAAEAAAQFQKALQAARPADTHIKTWSNIFLARLYDARNDRTQAVACYKAALATADTPATKALAEAGLKAPFRPSTGHSR